MGFDLDVITGVDSEAGYISGGVGDGQFGPVVGVG